MRILIAYLILGIFIMIFACVSYRSALTESLTYDEPVHISEGLSHLNDQRFMVDVVNPPLIRELAAIPLYLKYQKLAADEITAHTALPARMAIIFTGALLLYLIFLWASRIYGAQTALLAVFLSVINPLFLAYSHYVTLDFGFMALFFLWYAVFINYLIQPQLIRVLALGFVSGWLLAAKATALTYALPTAVVTVAYYTRNNLVKFLKNQSGIMLLLLFVAMITVWSSYFFSFSTIIAPGERPGRLSARLYQQASAGNNIFIIKGIEFLKSTKLPLGGYLEMLKNAFIYSKNQNQLSYFLGKYYSQPRWYFMTVNFFLKIPIIIILFLGLSVLLLVRDRAYRQNSLPFLWPILIILGYSALFPLTPRVRYVLPILPFISVLAASAFSYIYRTTRQTVFKLLLLSGLVISAWSVAASYPHFITYTNELIPHTSRFMYMDDSNLDWGQGLVTLANYVSQTKPQALFLSYFGRDNADNYGFVSDSRWSSFRADEICQFHSVRYPDYFSKVLVIISVSNWHYCGYMNDPTYHRRNIKQVVADSYLVF